MIGVWNTVVQTDFYLGLFPSKYVIFFYVITSVFIIWAGEASKTLYFTLCYSISWWSSLYQNTVLCSVYDQENISFFSIQVSIFVYLMKTSQLLLMSMIVTYEHSTLTKRRLLKDPFEDALLSFKDHPVRFRDRFL